MLPSEYNCRIPFPGFVHTKVKIIHGRSESFPTLADKLNKTLQLHVHIMQGGHHTVCGESISAFGMTESCVSSIRSNILKG
jgi:hypothetical protein